MRTNKRRCRPFRWRANIVFGKQNTRTFYAIHMFWKFDTIYFIILSFSIRSGSHTHTHTHEISLLHIELKYTVTPSSSSVRTHSQLNRETYIANSQETHHSSYLESFIVN